MKALQKLRELRDKGYFNRAVAWSYIASLFALLLLYWGLNGWVIAGYYHKCPIEYHGPYCVVKLYDNGCKEGMPEHICKPREIIIQKGESYGYQPHPLTKYQFTGSFILLIIHGIINHLVWVYGSRQSEKQNQ